MRYIHADGQPVYKRGQAIVKCIFSIDVEDWFHILDLASAPPMTDWDALPSQIAENFIRLLDIFEEKQVHVTCFFLGWVAERHPELVREAHRRGHEIASHGYAHRLAYEMKSCDFFQDAIKAKTILEDIIGTPVLGYRAPGFSVTAHTPWFFETLIEAGYTYDSSVFPAPRRHGGMTGIGPQPARISTPSGSLLEFPISVQPVMGRPICFFGGGYLRLFPYILIRRMAQAVLSEGRPVIFYLHPREINPDHPRLPMDLVRRFMSYVNVAGTRVKVRRILEDFDIMTFADYIAEGGRFQEEFR